VTRNGKPQSQRNALRAWTAALDKIGIDANLHSLRHTFISAHAERDTPVVLVSDLVGHARVTTTQTHNTHAARITATGALTTAFWDLLPAVMLLRRSTMRHLAPAEFTAVTSQAEGRRFDPRPRPRARTPAPARPDGPFVPERQ
jgi:Phage integrase family